MYKNKASISPIFIIVIILMIAVSGIAILLNTPSGNYKITINGRVERSITGEWSVTADLEDQTPDTYLSLMGLIPDIHWPWDTGRITVKCSLKNTATGEQYENSHNAGRVNSWIGGSTGYNFEIRNIPKGQYKVNMKVYEGDNSRLSRNIGTWGVG